jgi:hypothetical protein
MQITGSHVPMLSQMDVLSLILTQVLASGGKQNLIENTGSQLLKFLTEETAVVLDLLELRYSLETMSAVRLRMELQMENGTLLPVKTQSLVTELSW